MSRDRRTDADRARSAIIGLALLAVALGLAMNVTRLPLVGGGLTEYQAEFTDASGLVEGEEVRVAGVKVGNVTDLALNGDKVIATFGVRKVHVGDQSTASIEVKTLLGQHYLGLTPRGTSPLPEGGTIPLKHTSTPLNIVPAFNRLAKQSDEIDTDRLAESFDSLSDLLDQTAPDIRPTLEGLSRLSRSVSTRDTEIRQLFERSSKVTAALAARNREFSELLTSSRRVLVVLHRQRETIDRIIDGTSALSVQLSGLVRDNRTDLHAALRHLNRVLDVFRKNRDQIDEIIRLGDVYLRVFTNTVGTGPWFDSTTKFPNGMALCHDGGGSGTADRIIAEVLTEAGGSGEACIPLGDSAGGAS